MSKTLFTAALAFVLSIGAFAQSAEVTPVTSTSITVGKDYSLVKLVAQTEINNNLQSDLAQRATDNQEKVFGYKKGDKFVSLATLMENATVDSDGKTVKSATISLSGKFNKGDELQFGYGNVGDAGSFTPLEVTSDPFKTGYNIDSFYHLDFGEDPFNGMFDIMVMGEPLPASTVTMLVALAAAGAFLLYRNRKTRARISAQA